MQKIGVLLDEHTVIDLNAAYRDFLHNQGQAADADTSLAETVQDFLARGDAALQMARNVLQFARQQQSASPAWLRPAAAVRLTAPVPCPSKVVAIGQNYRDHCAEQGVKPPDRPIIFAKFPTSVIGPDEAITWNPELTSQVDYEAELGVVIGKRAKNVPQVEAISYVAGYLNANDVSARDLQFGDRQWVRGKSLDTFCPIGPYLVTPDEVADPHALAIRSILNGTVMQDSNTNNLIFTIPALIEFITRAITLLPGDIILTGTPPGVGVFREPKVLMQPGDTISIEVEGLGTLTNPVAAWPH